MEITRVRYTDISSEDKESRRPLAICSVYLDEMFVLHEIKIYKGKKGPYVVMPSVRNHENRDVIDRYCKKNKTSEDVFHPIKADYYRKFSDIILEGFYLFKDRSKRLDRWAYKPMEGVIVFNGQKERVEVQG